MIPLVPNIYRSGATLDPRIANENRQRRAADIDRSLSQRFHYSTQVYPLDGMTDASGAAVRRRALPNGANGFDIVAVELVVFTADANTWTVACTKSSGGAAPDGWRDVTVDGVSDNTKPARAAIELSASIPSGSAALFQLSCDGTSTITRGYLVVTVRYDRARSTGNSHDGYEPTLLDAANTDAVAGWNSEFAAEEAAVARDLANDRDVRVDSFTFLGLTAASAAALRRWRMPASGRTILKYVAHGVAAGGVSADIDVDAGALATVSAAMTINGAGLTHSGEPVESTYTPASPTVTADDPTDSADDVVFDVTVSGGTMDWLTIHVVSI